MEKVYLGESYLLYDEPEPKSQKKTYIPAPKPFDKEVLISDKKLLEDFGHNIFGVVSKSFGYNPFNLLDFEVNKSKYIYSLEDDWDDEGSIGYKKTTWENAVNIIREIAEHAYTLYNVIIDPPKIYQGPNGSIDMLWRNDNYNLLVNFPEDTEDKCTFFGETNNENIKGEFSFSSYCNLTMFLVGVSKCFR